MNPASERGAGMKGMLVPVAGLDLGGAALFGTMDSPDFERTVNRPPTAVYAAFDATLPMESLAVPREDGMPAVEVRISKVEGRSIRYELLLHDRAAVTADLTFAPAGPDGTDTLMTAEIDIDAKAIGNGFETEAGMALSMVPESYIDRSFAELMDQAVDEIEAGRPLHAVDADDFGVRRRDHVDVDDRRYEARRAQREAVQPMNRPTPMVDPDAAARAYREGRPNPNDARAGWPR